MSKQMKLVTWKVITDAYTEYMGEIDDDCGSPDDYRIAPQDKGDPK